MPEFGIKQVFKDQISPWRDNEAEVLIFSPLSEQILKTKPSLSSLSQETSKS